MPDLPPPDAPPPLNYTRSSRRRWSGYVAWAVILFVCVFIPVIRATKSQATVPTTAPSAVPHASADRPDLQVELAGKMFVGAARLMDLDRDALRRGVGLPQRTEIDKYATAIVTAEVGRPNEAVETLNGLDTADAAVLRGRYGGSSATMPATTPAAVVPIASTPAATRRAGGGPAALSDATRARLGWFARLADVYGRPDADPERAAVLKSAERAALAFGGAIVLVLAAGVVGLVMAVIAIVFLATNRVRFDGLRPLGPASAYVEAMAVYLGGFVATSLLIGRLIPSAPLYVQAAALVGVVVLAACWPLLRGVPWAVQRADWGVHAGRGVVREAVAGVAGYLAGLPVMAVGFAVTLALLAASGTQASHPIMQEAGGTWRTTVGLYLLASVFAPLSEELMFRGAFVSHLRAGVGVVAAAAVSGLVFAAVHPQGWAVVPVLAAVGAVFALIRQWRGSLVGSITAHAIHNAFVVTLLVVSTS